MNSVMLTLILGVSGLLIYAGVEKLRQIHTARQSVGTVTVTLTADTSQFEDAMRRAARGAADLSYQFGARLLPSVRELAQWFVEFGRRMEVWQVGVEAQYWTRGALYARLGYPDSCVNENVQAALREELLFPKVAAVAFIRGWVEHRVHPDDAAVAAARALPLNPHPMYDELSGP